MSGIRPRCKKLVTLLAETVSHQIGATINIESAKCEDQQPRSTDTCLLIEQTMEISLQQNPTRSLFPQE